MDFEAVLKRVGGILPVGGEGEFVPMDDKSIAALEKREGGPFPEVYKAFLQKYGACTPAESSRFQPRHALPTAVSKSGRCLVDVFYGGLLSDGSDDYSLRVRSKFFKRQIGPGFMPIADDGGGSQLCLCTDGPYAGSIYFWDCEGRRSKGRRPGDEEIAERDLPRQHLYYLADSFEELIEGLRPLPAST